MFYFNDEVYYIHFGIKIIIFGKKGRSSCNRCRPYSEYALGHLPNAVNTDLVQFHWIDTSKEGISQFNKQMKILLSNIGVTKNKFVVFYDSISGMFLREVSGY